MTFINSFIPVNFLNNGAELILDVGATEPLLNLTGSTTPTT
jgi:hypothetical protein